MSFAPEIFLNYVLLSVVSACKRPDSKKNVLDDFRATLVPFSFPFNLAHNMLCRQVYRPITVGQGLVALKRLLSTH